jgi:23S rRNA pseudouridine1911/1915/1917 synthase
MTFHAKGAIKIAHKMSEQLFRFQIGEGGVDQRLDRFLATRLGHLSRMRIHSLLTQGACTVNKTQGAPGYHLRQGDLLEIRVEDSGPTAMTPEALPLDILYEDQHLLVLNKHAGMLVHPTRNEKTGTLMNALSYHLNRGAEDELIRPGLVHRLDRATSGLMVIAKRERALSVLTRHFHRRLVEKRYAALLDGRVAEDLLVIDAPIGRDAEAHPKWRVSPAGRHAETRLQVIERLPAATLVELEPVTGRTNQLRIHCAHIGHAILGDSWYGTDSGARLCLHAARLCFHHPADGEWMEFTSPLPEEITEGMRDKG